MSPESFLRITQPLDEGFLLVSTTGEIVAANAAALRLLPAGTPANDPGNLAELAVEPTDRIAAYLRSCSRTTSLTPGTLTMRADGRDPVKVRCDGALIRARTEAAPALLLMRLRPQSAATLRFLALNRQIEKLNREIEQRRRGQEALQAQALELEELTAELEQTVEELIQRTEEAEQARTAAERAATRTAVLAEAGAMLSSSMQLDVTLQNLARLATQTIADYCVTYLCEENGTIRRVGVAHADPASEPLVLELQRLYPPDPGSSSGAGLVIRTGESILVSEIPDEMLVAAAQDAEHLRILRALRPRSSIVVPLQARGRTLGALAVATVEKGMHPYAEGDLALVEELAHRAALAIDNARLLLIAEEANRAKANFLAIMSHELRTPLNAVIGYADLLEAEVGGPLTRLQQDHLARIKRAAQHLATIIEEILTYSRLEAGKEQVKLDEVDLERLIDEAAELVAPAVTPGLRLYVQPFGRPVRIVTDAAKVRQILFNLLGNAVKFTDAGEITLWIELAEPWVLIHVRDTGVGIEPDNLSLIFDPFWQVDQANTRRAGGTGLGLTVTRRLADLLGGGVSVESAPGQGSTFTVRLPISSQD